MPSSGNENCSLNASSSGETGAELIEERELSSSNDVDGIEDTVMEEVGSLYCRSGIWSLSLERSTRFFRSPTPVFFITPIVSGFLSDSLDLVALEVLTLSGNTRGTTKP